MIVKGQAVIDVWNTSTSVPRMSGRVEVDEAGFLRVSVDEWAETFGEDGSALSDEDGEPVLDLVQSLEFVTRLGSADLVRFARMILAMHGSTEHGVRRG